MQMLADGSLCPITVRFPAREALGGDRARPFQVAGSVPALNERAQPFPFVGGEVPSLRCSGISGTSPKYKPCSACQSLYALQSDTMVSVIRRLAIFRKAWFAARLPMALACERNRLTLAILSSSSPRDMTDLGTDLPPCPLYQCATPRDVPRDVATGGLSRRAASSRGGASVQRPSGAWCGTRRSCRLGPQSAADAIADGLV